ncbi:MAG: glycosyltransferase family 4 protein [Caldimonas sp.]
MSGPDLNALDRANGQRAEVSRPELLDRPTAPFRPRVLIVAESASARFGGEAALPLHYYRVLRKRGIPVWLLSHARTRTELSAVFPADSSIEYVDDTRLNRLMWQIGRRFPPRLSHFTFGFVSRLATQLAQRRLARSLVEEHAINVVHQPMPVSPREPSMMFDLGAPVVIGPLNGGMDYPDAFRRRSGLLEDMVVRMGRAGSSFFNRLMPGKRRASLLLVANPRTRAALPSGVCPRVDELVENGVDLDLWTSKPEASCIESPSHLVRFVYLGRLVHWKGIEFLLEAFAQASRQVPMHLLIAGDGEERQRLESLAKSLGIAADEGVTTRGVTFAGWMSQDACAEALQDADCLVLPSLLECGGAVVLEAMSMAKPVIACAWGGPLDYLDSTCGILVLPTDSESLVAGFRDAMVDLASSPDKVLELGRAGRRKVEREYDWDVKVERMLDLYESVQLKVH